MRSSLLLFFIVWIGCKSSSIQNQQREKIIHLEVDKLGNIYIVNDKNIIKKISKQGQVFDLVDNRLGKISSIDLSNPLSILVFYQGQSLIRIIDNTMSDIKQINLLTISSFSNISAVCWANDGNIWVHDMQHQKAFKISLSGKIINETNHFNDLGLNGFVPVKMIERNNLLCISDKNNKIILFDNFGQFNKQFILQSDNYYFDGKFIYSLVDKNVKIQSVLYPEINELPLNPKKLNNSKRLIRENNAWYIINDYDYEIIND